MFDLITGEHVFFRDSRTRNPTDNYALEDVSGIHYDFTTDRLYTGILLRMQSQIRNQSGFAPHMDRLNYLALFVAKTGGSTPTRNHSCLPAECSQ